ncbi:hypothetical protein [Nostoc sp. MS1]|uniref:hypothetical protein n=1 Tax=Nostoc sp. MS1 TaxID=2764711 RepID=UPI001CC6F71F|nr:hypothetical protein [Nostoc sp. MS1]BCL40264.1 hypothetical protein NSMS1_67110 [Nostoc sp. MS1]
MVWKSAAGDNPQPALSEDYIIECIKAWQRRETMPRNERVIVNNPSNVIPHPTVSKQTLTSSELLTEIDSLIAGSYKQSELEVQLLELSTRVGYIVLAASLSYTNPGQRRKNNQLTVN